MNFTIGLIRSLPNFKILLPCDPLEAEQATRIAYETEGPVYIRMVRPALHFILPSDYKMKIGKAVMLHEGQDITIIAYGMTVPIALTAASNLKSEGISARVLNMSTIKPIDKNSILAAAQETSRIITVEDHSIIGGLGSAVSEIVAESGKGKVTRIGIPDTFGESCPYEDLYKKFGLTVENIVKKVKENL